MIEDKALICHRLADVLKLTMKCSDVRDIVYYPDSEDAVIQFEPGRKPKVVNVSCDSGWALIQDILIHLV